MSNFSTNLTGRMVDIGMFQNLPVISNQDKQSDMSFGYSGVMVGGVARAVQTWCLVLFTRKGTVLADPNFGTNFLTLLQSGQVNDDTSLQAAFTDAAQTAIAYNGSRLTGTENPDEYVTAANLISYSMANHVVTMTIQLTTGAGNSRVIILPTTIPIR